MPTALRRPVPPVGAVRGLAVGVLAVIVLAVGLPAREAAADPVRYRPPVPGPIVSAFSLPAEAWGPGNRGVDYDPPPGTPVTAAADGEVVFAGAVAGALHVTVRHADGLRTSYSFLASVAVRVGATVRAGEPVGTAGGPVHFGVRAPDGTYLDPAALLAGQLEGRPVLVPGTAEGADPLVERRHLLDVVLGPGRAAAAWATAPGRALVRHAGNVTSWVLDVAELTVDELRALVEDLLGRCTDGSVAQPVLQERRIMVLVSGLGTGSGDNSAFELPVEDLGYAPADVVRFSYAGGRSPHDEAPFVAGDPGLAGIPQREFDHHGSQQPIATSADALADLLAEVARREPGVPIDVVAHSQGGVVSRAAIDQAGRQGELPAEVQNLVTLGSPHAGAYLADGITAMRGSAAGRAVLGVLEDHGVQAPLDPDAPAIADLATGSDVTEQLHDRPLPGRVRFTSIGARWDTTVPADRTRDDAARHVVVDAQVRDDDGDLEALPSQLLGAHGELTTTPEAVREVALAVNGMAPSCQSVVDRLGDLAASGSISLRERALSDALEASAPLLDAYGPLEPQAQAGRGAVSAASPWG